MQSIAGWTQLPYTCAARCVLRIKNVCAVGTRVLVSFEYAIKSTVFPLVTQWVCLDTMRICLLSGLFYFCIITASRRGSGKKNHFYNPIDANSGQEKRLRLCLGWSNRSSQYNLKEIAKNDLKCFLCFKVMWNIQKMQSGYGSVMLFVF